MLLSKNKIFLYFFLIFFCGLAVFTFYILKPNTLHENKSSLKIDHKEIKKIDLTFSKKKKEDIVSEKKTEINTDQYIDVNYNEIDSLLSEINEFEVAEEKLISLRNIKVISLGLVNKEDTTFSQLTGIKQSNNSTVFSVEFWKTPLNSKGYRMTLNKIIIYGLVDLNDIIIYQLDDNFYLKNDEFVYQLSPGSEFKQLELVNNSELLNKIN